MAQNNTDANGEGPSSPTRTPTPTFTSLLTSSQHRFPTLTGGGSRTPSCLPPPLPKLYSWLPRSSLSLYAYRPTQKNKSSGPSPSSDIATCLIGFSYCSHPYCTSSTNPAGDSSRRSGHPPSVSIIPPQQPRSLQHSTLLSSQDVVAAPASSRWANCSNNPSTAPELAITPPSPVPSPCPPYIASSIYTYSTGKHKCPDEFFPNCTICGSCRHCCHSRLTQLHPTPQRCIPLQWVEPVLLNGARGYPTNNILCSHPLTNTSGKYCCSGCVHPCTVCDSC
jgi:hypothetical protein